MKKFIFTLLAFVLTVSIAHGASNLYEFYAEMGQDLPSVAERSKVAENAGIGEYLGTYEQNMVLLDYLQGSEINLGATIPTVVGFFETSLASKITSSATSMTLVTGVDDDGTSLSGTYGFIIDEGSSSEEVVVATCTGTSCISMRRGVSVLDGWTEVSDNKKSHRRGASVKMTNYPQLAIISRILNGDESFPNALTMDGALSIAGKITYSSTPTIDADLDVATKQYADNIANQGAATSSITVAGITELATQIEMASSTVWGADDPHVIQSQYATSTPYTGMNGLWVVVSENDGKLSQNWLDLSESYSWTGDHTFSGDTTFSGSVLGVTAFGGDGTDGALNITSGTTTIDLGNADYVVKNYTSINISSGAGLAFSNPGTNGTIIKLKSQGNVTIAGTLDASGMGAVGGDGGAGGKGDGSGVAGSNGSSGTKGISILDSDSHGGAGGDKSLDGSSVSGGDGGAALTDYKNFYTLDEWKKSRNTIIIAAGSGGGGGGGGRVGSQINNAVAGDGGDGGRGGGALILQVNGTFTFTGTIDVSGDDGSDGEDGVNDNSEVSGSGGGGGGASGMAYVIYESIGTNSGTITAAGGDGGDGGDSLGSDDGSINSGGGGGGAGSYTAAGGAGAGGSNIDGYSCSGCSGVGAVAGGGSGGGNTTPCNRSGGSGGSGGSSDTNVYLITENTDL